MSNDIHSGLHAALSERTRHLQAVAQALKTELFGIDTHGRGVGLITVNAWSDVFQPDLTHAGTEVRLDVPVPVPA